MHPLTETGRVAAKSCRWIRSRSTRLELGVVDESIDPDDAVKDFFFFF